MIDITERHSKCCADRIEKCDALVRKDCYRCRFYKPVDCEDWIRLDKDGHTYLIEPENYEKERKQI